MRKQGFLPLGELHGPAVLRSDTGVTHIEIARSHRLPRLIGCFVALLILLGCDPDRSNSVGDGNKAGSAFLLSDEPTDPCSPTEAKETHLSPGPIVLEGRIDAGDFDPFESGSASFVLSQLPDEDHAQGDPDHADNCPFCKRKLKNAPKVVVKFNDDKGEVVAVDARELLGVKKGDSVVVNGTGHYNASVNMVEIAADGVFVR